MKSITAAKIFMILTPVLASPVFADVAADIGAAKTSGMTNVGLAVSAVIAIAAIALGVSLVRGLLSR